MKIIWTRDSVCMGDDCTAPNTKTEKIDRPLTISDLLDRAADYVPNISGSVWAVWIEGILAGYLEMSASGYLLRDEPVLEGTLSLKPQMIALRQQPADLHVHCSFYIMSDFLYRNGPDGRPLAEHFPPYAPLLDMVKASVTKA